MAIWLPRLAIDRWRLTEELKRGEGDDAAPFALIAETAHGPRITATNDAGLAAGACAGAMLADARAICPRLTVAPADQAADLAFLEKLALWAQRWGPWVAIDPPNGIIVDITGAAHLFGGETRLLEDVRKALGHRHLSARFAIGPTAGAAWALAHFGKQGGILPPDADPLDHLADLSVAALRLETETVLLLRRLGLKHIGELRGVARDSLVRRFRNRTVPDTNPLIRLDQLIGHVPEPILPVLAVEAPMVQRRLLEPIRYRELLDRVVTDLAVDMAGLLESLALGARRLALGMWRVDGGVSVARGGLFRA
jgi:protein ImuB